VSLRGPLLAIIPHTGGFISKKYHVQEAKRNSETRINIRVDNISLHTSFNVSGRRENRHFSPGDNMFPGTHDRPVASTS
jgi:hypothetical protein